MIKNKVVVITGASSGIGAACALEFAAKGSSLVLAARNAGNLEGIAEACRDLNAEVVTVAADVAVEEDCRRIIDAAVMKFGRIDVLINNAGISMRALFEDCDLDVIRRVMDTNFWGTVYCTKYALPHILRQKGSIVGVSSIAGFKGLPGRTGYSASKFAMQGFLEALRIENLKKGLHVLIACPGFTASNIRNTALDQSGKSQGESPRQEQKMMQPETVAKEIYKAVQKKRNTLVLTANGKLTVLLNKLFPSMMDKMVFSHMSKEPGSPF